MSQPLVSIVVPAYNAERFIRRSLCSAMNQTYDKLEIIVIDDGSTDRTEAIVRSIVDPRLRYLRQRNGGQGAARNYGMRECHGEYVTFLDADDYYLPEKIDKQIRSVVDSNRFGAAYCNCAYFYSATPEEILSISDVEWPSGNILAELLSVSFNPNTLMIAREVVDKIGWFNERRYYPEDWEYFLRIALAGYEFAHVDEELVIIEVRPDSNTNLEIQPALKRNAIEMFERLIPEPLLVDGRVVSARPVLRRLRMKLAVACLLNGHVRDCETVLTELLRSAALGKIATLPLRLTPRPMLRWLWESNLRRRSRRAPSWRNAEGVPDYLRSQADAVSGGNGLRH